MAAARPGGRDSGFAFVMPSALGTARFFLSPASNSGAFLYVQIPTWPLCDQVIPHRGRGEGQAERGGLTPMFTGLKPGFSGLDAGISRLETGKRWFETVDAGLTAEPGQW